MNIDEYEGKLHKLMSAKTAAKLEGKQLSFKPSEISLEAPKNHPPKSRFNKNNRNSQV